MTQSINEKIGTVAAIEPEGHFVQIGRKVFGADLVPTAHDPSLQQTKSRFHGIGCDARAVFVTHIFSGKMVDDFVLGSTYSVFVSRKAIGNQHLNVRAHVLADILCQRPALGIFGVEESQITVALAKADDYFFVRQSRTLTCAAILSADVGFIHLDSTIQHRAIHFFHGSTNAMAKVPRGFVRTFMLSPNCPLELTGTHTLFGFTEEQDSHKPEGQCQVGIVEHRTSSHGELITAFTTGKLFPRVNPPDVAVMAPGAVNAFGPTEPGENLAAIFVGGIEPIQIRECHDRTS